MDTQTRYSGKLKKVNLKINLKTAFMTGLVTMLGLAGTMTADAATISDDGKYTLIMDVMDGDINGEEYGKMIRFNVEDGETTVKLSELTEGIVPFRDGNEFEYWGKGIFGDERAMRKSQSQILITAAHLGMKAIPMVYDSGCLFR